MSSNAKPTAGSELDATTIDISMDSIQRQLGLPLEDDQGLCLIQIHPVVGRCGVVQLGPKTTVIGREKDADLSVEMASVSRHHAKIERQPDGRYRLIDLDSTNGTFVNDVRVREWDLDPSDIVRCGGAMLKVLPADDLEARYHEVAYMMMTHDSLTGIHNRQYFEDLLTRELASCVRYKDPMALLMLDIDHFKAVNDLHGHLAGDDVLREFARRIQTVLRGENVVARLGGEEFGVIIQHADLAKATTVAERLRMAIAARKFRVTDARIPITVSIGLASIDGHSETSPQELLRQADENLYKAKASGRDCVHAGAQAEPV
jgi:diguanylate cyclase (GGDEF)-like protein